MFNSSFCHQLDRLSFGLSSPAEFVRANQINKSLINRLGLEASLQGHQGCVNCLEWNDRGTHLASGSDDCCIILWDPFVHKSICVMNTGHVGNIFSVKFLQNLNESLIVTAAADSKVRVHDISRMETRHVFCCHSGRVKRLANTLSEPFLFWSASEDGTVRQFDLRDPSQASSPRPRNVLVDLHCHIGSFAEAKCLALNTVRAEQLAIGGNDPYVRVYDRRMLSLSAFSYTPRSWERRQFHSVAADSDLGPLSKDSVRYLIPGHLPRKEVSYRRSLSHVNVTCVTFSPDGSELLANMGGDHIYLFNMNKLRPPYSCAGSQIELGMITSVSPNQPPKSHSVSQRCSLTSGIRFRAQARYCDQDTHSISCEQAALNAAQLVKAKAFVAAVRAYNESIQRWPSEPQLYTGRATALLKRGWNGDIYSAFLDCQSTLNLLDSHESLESSPSTRMSFDCIAVTALLLAARCLLRLDWVTESRVMLNKVQQRYPSLIQHSSYGAQPASKPKLTTTVNNKSTSDNSGANGLVVVEQTDAPNLYKFFHMLDCDVCLREGVLASLDLKDEHTNEVTDKPRSSDVACDPGQSASVSSVLPGSPSIRDDPVSPEPPEADPENDTDDSWTPIWFTSRDLNEVTDEPTSPSPPPHCSCLGCVTKSCTYENENERYWRTNSTDYTRRFLGHCNAITDIKEANFFGGNGQYIVGGSDCGSFFVWDRETTNTVRIMEADSSTVNCVQPHPSICLLATSGIDSVVRLWSPRSDDDANQSCVVKDHVGAAERNQRRSVADPLEIMLLNMGYRIPGLDANFTSRRSRSRGRPRQPTSTNEGNSVEATLAPTDETNASAHRLSGLSDEDHEDSFSNADQLEENYDNPDDIEGLPEIPGATVYPTRSLMEGVSIVDLNINDVERNCDPDIQTNSAVDPRPPVLNDSAPTHRLGSQARKRLHSDSTSVLLPPVALTAFEDDSSGTESERNHPLTTPGSASADRDVSAISSGRRPRSSVLALHSLLPNGDHFVVYGTAPPDEAQSRRTGSGMGAESGNSEGTTDRTVVEVPCTMS